MLMEIYVSCVSFRPLELVLKVSNVVDDYYKLMVLPYITSTRGNC